MSDDGQKLAAVVGGTIGDGRHIYTSSNSGKTWTDRSTAGSGISGNKNWTSVAMSSDGSKLAAVATTHTAVGRIYTSTDKGASWARRTSGGNRGWQSIAVSSNGDKLAAVANNGHIYTATNSGATWTWTDRSTQEAP